MRHPFRLSVLLGAMMFLAGHEAIAAERLVSPEFLSDGSVTFRLLAPQAQSVLVDGEWPPRKRTAMTKGENGVWQVTLRIAPEIYQYRFNVDGAAVVDPNNRWVKPGHYPFSLIDVPAESARAFDLKPDTPRGAVAEHAYFSKSLKTERRFRVYTPPGYLRSNKKLPVLYLLHGSTDSEASWTTQGRANVIADNLLADGRIREMLIVMPYGHAEDGAQSRDPRAREHMYDRFETDLLKDVMPLVEKNYRVQSGADHCAIIGLSMGGAQSLHVGLANTDKFHWIGVFSQGILPQESTFGGALARPEELNARLKWFWIGIGKDDGRVQRARDFSAHLNELGIRHNFVESDGGHSWDVWRGYLRDVLPQLFRE
jgi:enterochelin esterase-like enzyme